MKISYTLRDTLAPFITEINQENPDWGIITLLECKMSPDQHYLFLVLAEHKNKKEISKVIMKHVREIKKIMVNMKVFRKIPVVIRVKFEKAENPFLMDSIIEELNKNNEK